MELATANAVFQSAMKIPAFVAKPILSCFLFLFACFLFLLIAPNISKPAYAAWTITDPPTWSGTNVTFRWDTPANTALDLIIVDWDDPLHTAVWDSGTDIGSGSIDGKTTLTVNTSSWHVGPGVTIDGNFAVTLVAFGASLQSNRVIFAIPAAPGGQITLTANASGTTVTFGFSPNANSLTSLVIVNDTTNKVVKDSGILGDVPSYTWDATGQPAGPYHAQVFVGQVSFSNPAPFTLGGAPPPPPGTGCNIVPTNNSFGTLQTPNVNGNSVIFNLGRDSGGFVIIVENASTGAVAKDSGALPAGTTTWPWTAPDGTYCAAVFYGTAAVSNVVNFQVPSGATGDTCSSSALMWVNDVRCRAIAGGWFDSDVFTLGQSALALESLSTMVWGQSILLPKVNPATANRGALALTGKAVASLYGSPPASGVEYFAQKIRDLNPIQPAFAAAGGIGYQTLGPVQKIWVAFRNIAYVGFIIVFVIMGFMIMFRAHISPQAVATVQDSIPRLVIALILVTFSYAIAGFMIDIMFLFLNIAIQALVSTKLITGADFVFKDNVFTVIFSNWKDTFKVVSDAVAKIIGDTVSLPGTLGFVTDIVGWTGGSIAALVVGIALLFIMFRVFLMLLMAYVMIIILTMFAPFFFLIQALPGNNGAKEWFRQMASNIAVFPTVALMFILAGIMGGMTKLGAASESSVIQAGQIGQFPLIIGSLDTGAIGKLIGIGFLLVTPSAAEIVKNAFGGKGQGGGMGNFGAAALGAAAAGAGVVGAGARQVWSGGGPIADYRRVRAAKQETYRGLIARSYANQKWKNKTGDKDIPEY